MSKILAPGRVVILLSGRYAGKKAVISSVNLQKTKDRDYGFVTVVGVERAPLKITRAMSDTVQRLRTSVKAFCKVVNVNHLMPTKYTVNLDQLNLIKDVKINTFEAGKPYPIATKKALSSQFAEVYRNGKESWLFTKLRF
ncbi:60S ribosomal protein L27-A, putative [Entamoeba invadens IP1]|uniref:60S ribosomal protein L27-A, putative n=1 Tax=Entamoeba invadens IP1 TaxID=370355 RepID=A0A0A1UCL8_ENTIV|nr:60S ribosomal protein L27-A, putative [Entamoeba invadens IP1]ELP93669.1 60S ribosomal protein L27-A, putative [Entamoeba invadens IP1]|eukprot:XP_004260440.1 60S ribosomal protein L27-A, putative [Entamoeba invadens IP1]